MPSTVMDAFSMADISMSTDLKGILNGILMPILKKVGAPILAAFRNLKGINILDLVSKLNDAPKYLAKIANLMSTAVGKFKILIGNFLFQI